MKIKLVAALLLTGASTSFGAAGIFDGFLFTSTNGGGLAFYDLGATTGNTDFQGAALGSFNPASATFTLGGQHKTFKNNGTDVTGSSLFYRVWLTSGGASGSFTSVNMPFQLNLVTPGDQQWGGNVQNANPSLVQSGNVLSGLANGAYTLEAYSQITTNGVNEATTIANNNSNNNYRATFTVIPEPSAAILGAVGALILLRRRR